MGAAANVPTSDRVREILTGAQINGNLLVITERLSREDYVAVNKVLVNLGGKWSRRDKAHVFDQDPTGALARVLDTGQVLRPATASFTEGYVATPRDLAERIIREHTNIGDLPAGAAVLEPSAGDGNLVAAIIEANPDVRVVAVEPNQDRATRIPRTERDGQVTVDIRRLEDYHQNRTDGLFDEIVMNPPFRLPDQPTAWIDHVRLAWKLLKPGGRLTAIVPQGFVFRSDRNHTAFRAWHAEFGGGHVELEDGAFSESGTGVHAVVLWVDKPADYVEPAAPVEPEPKPKRRGRSKKKLTPEEIKQRNKDLNARAKTALDDPEFMAKLNTALANVPQDSNFAQYSDLNKALFYIQCIDREIIPEGYTATLKGWRELHGRKVREGGKGVLVRSPRTKDKATKEADDQAARQLGDEESGEFAGVYMRYVFDRSQTEPIEQPDTSTAPNTSDVEENAA